MIAEHERRELKAFVNKPNVLAYIRYLALIFLLNIICCFFFFMTPSMVHEAEADILYTVSIEGISDHNLQNLLKDTLNSVAFQDKPVASFVVLRRRVKQDIQRVITILRSHGFYSVHVTHEIKPDESPVRVIFKIDPGQLYLIKHLDIQVRGEGEMLRHSLSLKEDVGLELETPAEAKKILDTRDRLMHWFKTKGFPFTRMGDPNVIVDHSDQSVSVTYVVYSGVKAYFGLTRIEGLESVEEPFIRSKIPWKAGDLFNLDLFQEMKKNFYALGVFATIDVKEGETLDEENRLPVFIHVRERKHRTVKAGISYATDEGLGGRTSWEHRNIFQQGERLSISGGASGIAYSTEGIFHKPQFQRSDQALILNLRLAEDHPEAYTSRNIAGLIKIERSLSNEIRVGVGLGDRMSRIDQLDRVEYSNLFSLPISLDWNTSNDLLDPVRGGHLSTQVDPYYETYGSDLRFTKGLFSYRRYFSVSSSPVIVLATRGSMGVMEGAERDDIPADIRFYAGGGGSIRGYPYQSVGPIQDGMAIGGRSLLSLSSELRAKFTDTFGLVLFIDGGNAYETTFPDLDKSLYWGIGIGLRYFTAIGPLRMDVAFPLTQREGMDDAFQIYVSIGQAF
jgi:translocation and assembly module TamA